MQADTKKNNRNRWDRPPQWGTTAIVSSPPRRELRGRLRNLWFCPRWPLRFFSSRISSLSVPFFVSLLTPISSFSSSITQFNSRPHNALLLAWPSDMSNKGGLS